MRNLVDWSIEMFGSKTVDSLQQQLEMYRAKAADAKRFFDINVKLEDDARKMEKQHESAIAAKDGLIRMKEEHIASMVEAVSHTERLQNETREQRETIQRMKDSAEGTLMENRAFRTEIQRLDAMTQELEQKVQELQESLSRTKADASKIEGALAEIARIIQANQETGASVVAENLA